MVDNVDKDLPLIYVERFRHLSGLQRVVVRDYTWENYYLDKLFEKFHRGFFETHRPLAEMAIRMRLVVR